MNNSNPFCKHKKMRMKCKYLRKYVSLPPVMSAEVGPGPTKIVMLIRGPKVIAQIPGLLVVARCMQELKG